METPTRRLFPTAEDTTIEAGLEGYLPSDHPHPDRPWVAVNMISTLDGRASIDGGSRGLGSSADSAHLLALRTRFDAVMIGGGTMRAERYGRIVKDPQVRARRERIGLPHDPLAVIVSGRLDLPWDAPLFTCGAGRILIFTESEEIPPPVASSLRTVRLPEIDMTAVLRHLREVRGVRSVLCEGGPGILGQLLADELLDEMFLTLTPVTTNGDAPRITAGEVTAPRDFELTGVQLAEGDLFTRYRRRN